MQGHVALEFDCADLKCPGRDEDCAAAIVRAGIDCSLQRGRVECDAITLGPEVTNVIDAGTRDPFPNLDVPWALPLDQILPADS